MLNKRGKTAINLNRSDSVWVDKGERSITYFCKNTPTKVDRILISELKEIIRKADGKNVRLCLHSSPGALFHDMVIVEQRGKYYRPHKHLIKSETFHIIAGRLGVLLFDADGKITDASILNDRDALIYKIGMNVYHAVMPISQLVIYHEARLGPFDSKKDNIFAPWSPDGADSEKTEEYIARLRKYLDVH